MPILALNEKCIFVSGKAIRRHLYRSIKSDPDLSWSLFFLKGIGLRRGF